MNQTKYRSISNAILWHPEVNDFLNSTRPMVDIFDMEIPIDESRRILYKKLYRNIGNTPCYEARLPNDNLLLIKMECFNSLGNSHYSRFWLPYLFIAEGFGIIEPGKTHLLEVSSGSAGISLSMACQLLNFQVSIIVPSILPYSRISPMYEFGANVIHADGYISGCIAKLKDMLAKGKYFAPNHSEERSNFAVSTFSRIAEEFITQKRAYPDFVILGLGNGTSTEGIFRFLKKCSPTSKLFAYHPQIDGDQFVLGLYNQSIHLRHVPMSINLADKIYCTSNLNIVDSLLYFNSDTEINSLGLSSIYGVSLAMMISSFVNNKTFMTIGYDRKDRY